MNTSPSERFDLEEELSAYFNDLQKKGISLQLVRERMKDVEDIETFQMAIRELLNAVVFPDLSESGESILQSFFDAE
jgi:hypothetical protein